MRAYVALGSNLGDRGAFLTRAVDAVRALPSTSVLRESKRRETEALRLSGDDSPQPRYLNAVVEVETSLSAHTLFSALKRIEGELGRTPAPKWSARVIDLDLLLFGDELVETERLTVPHPRLHERRFVLEPLVELAPALVHPRLKRTAAQLLHALTKPGDVFWLESPSEIRHPHVVVRVDGDSVELCALTSNLQRAKEPGNVLLELGEGGLVKQSVVVVSQRVTVEVARLHEAIGELSENRVAQVLEGVRFQAALLSAREPT